MRRAEPEVGPADSHLSSGQSSTGSLDPAGRSAARLRVIRTGGAAVPGNMPTWILNARAAFGAGSFTEAQIAENGPIHVALPPVGQRSYSEKADDPDTTVTSED